jgi:hypothetical protein
MKVNLIKSLKGLLVVPALVLSLGVVLAPAVSAADDLTLKGGVDSAKGEDQSTTLFGDSGVFKTITNVLLFIIGAISVIMLVIGGIRYTISGGDSNQVTAAKNTILYAIIGIVVAILAYAVVSFVTNSLVE